MLGHVCDSIDDFPLDTFHQRGEGSGKKILILGESPAPNGWALSGKACYRSDGKILPTGKRLNELLAPFNISVDVCGFTELSKCYVSDRKDLKTCSQKCLPILIDQLKNTRYKLIIVLGVETAKMLSCLLDTSLIVGEMRQAKIGLKKYEILPIFHPSPRNPSGKKKNEAIFTLLRKNVLNVLQ